jgi:hypothetical protein
MSSTVKIARNTTAKVQGMLVTEVIVTVMTVLLFLLGHYAASCHRHSGEVGEVATANYGRSEIPASSSAWR